MLSGKTNPRFFSVFSNRCYLFSSLLVALVHLGFCKTVAEMWVVGGVYIATLLNLALLMYLVEQILGSSSDQKKSKLLLIGAFFGKMLILFGAIVVGVHFVGNRVLVAIINYVIQVFVLGIFLHRHNLVFGNEKKDRLQ